MLTLYIIPIALIVSLVASMPSLLWLILTGVWVAVFLSFYLVFLPIAYNKLSYGVHGDKFVLNKGILYTRVYMIPLGSVQFSSVRQGPLSKFFGLATVIIFAAGAKITIAGLKLEPAHNLSELLSQQES